MSGLSPEEIAELEELSRMLSEGTYYELFDLSEDFERGQLKTAYYDLSRRFHPDRFYRVDLGGHEETLEKVFAGVNEAYRVLGNAEDRRRYDVDIGRRRPRKRRRTSAPAPSAEPASASAPGPAASVDPPRRVSRERPGTTHTARPAAEVLGGRAAEGRAAAAGAEEAPATPPEHVVQWSRPAAAPAKEAEEEPKKRRKKKKRPEATRPPPPGVSRMREQLIERMRKARAYYRQGLKEAEEGAWVKAASSFYLATKYDSRNTEYPARHAEADRKAKAILANQHIERARKAESFRNHQEAFNNYTAAAACDPDTGEPWFRLAQLVIRLEDDTRAALNHYRKAVEKEPANIEFRMALASSYEEHDMKRNAHREFSAVLELQKDNLDAKEGAKRTR